MNVFTPRQSPEVRATQVTEQVILEWLIDGRRPYGLEKLSVSASYHPQQRQLYSWRAYHLSRNVAGDGMAIVEVNDWVVTYQDGSFEVISDLRFHELYRPIPVMGLFDIATWDTQYEKLKAQREKEGYPF